MQCIGYVLHSGQVHHQIYPTIVLRAFELKVHVVDVTIAQEVLIYRCYRHVHRTIIRGVVHRF